MNNKKPLRTIFLSNRQSLSTDRAQLNSQKICQSIINTYPSKRPLKIAIYLPIGNEIDLRNLLSSSHICHVPSVKNKNMQFQQWTKTLNIQSHQLGMKQPAFLPHQVPPNLDICFLPLVAFDKTGTRLGMGGGYYDRYFQHQNQTKLIGVAHDCQQHPSLPRDPWDVKLHAIITESQFINFTLEADTA